MFSVAMAWSVEFRNFNSYSATGNVFFVFVLFCVASGGSPDILLTIDFREASADRFPAVPVQSMNSSTGV